MENIYDPYIYHQVDQSFRHYYLSEPLLKKKKLKTMAKL